MGAAGRRRDGPAERSSLTPPSPGNVRGRRGTERGVRDLVRENDSARRLVASRGTTAKARGTVRGRQSQESCSSGPKRGSGAKGGLVRERRGQVAKAEKEDDCGGKERKDQAQEGDKERGTEFLSEPWRRSPGVCKDEMKYVLSLVTGNINSCPLTDEF